MYDSGTTRFMLDHRRIHLRAVPEPPVTSSGATLRRPSPGCSPSSSSPWSPSALLPERRAEDPADIRAKIAASSSIDYPLDHRVSPPELPTAAAEQVGCAEGAGVAAASHRKRVSFLTNGDEAYDAVTP